MPTYVDYGGRVNSTIVGWVEVTADTEYSLGLRGPPIVTLEFPFVDTNSRALTIDKTGTNNRRVPARHAVWRNAAWDQTSDATDTTI